MNRFVYAALAVGALSQTAGCIITTGSDAEIDVAWEIDGQFDYGDGCAELDAVDVEVVTRRIGSGDVVVDLIECTAGSVIIDRRSGDYDLWLNAVDSRGRLLGSSETVAIEVFSGERVVIEDRLAFLNGQFVATWELRDEVSDDLLRCDEAGVGGISVLTTLAGGGGTGFDDIFDCPASAVEGDIVTDPLPLGTYSVDVSVLEAQTDEVLSEPVIKEGTISDHLQRVDLGVYEFLFN